MNLANSDCIIRNHLNTIFVKQVITRNLII